MGNKKDIFIKALSNSAGYTLITTAIVITTIGMIIVALSSMYFVYERKKNIMETDQVMTKAREGIERFISVNGYLPCPAPMNATQDSQYYNTERYSQVACVNATFSGITSSDGIAEVDGTRVASEKVFIGALPVRTLGLSDRYAFDSFGKRIVYAVTASYTAPDDNDPSTPTADFKSDNGQIEVSTNQDNNGDGAEDSALNVPGSAIYTIISPGKDNRGAYSVAGQLMENCDTSSFAGENCDYDDATFNVSMKRNYGISDDRFTNTFYYRAALDVYKWVTVEQSCRCHHEEGGNHYFKVKPVSAVCNDSEDRSVSASLCKSAQPDTTPVDCSAHSVVADCFDWFADLDYNNCDTSCGTDASTIYPNTISTECMHYLGSESTSLPSKYDDSQNNDPDVNLYRGSYGEANGIENPVDCYREALNDPVSSSFPKACARTGNCSWRERWNAWGSCSAVCEGSQNRTSYWQCYDPANSSTMPDSKCTNRGQSKPGSNTQNRACGDPICYQWREIWSSWSACSAACEGQQSRTTSWECYNPRNGSKVSDSSCTSQGKSKPRSSRTENRTCGTACYSWREIWPECPSCVNSCSNQEENLGRASRYIYNTWQCVSIVNGSAVNNSLCGSTPRTSIRACHSNCGCGGGSQEEGGGGRHDGGAGDVDNSLNN